MPAPKTGADRVRFHLSEMESNVFYDYEVAGQRGRVRKTLDGYVELYPAEVA